MRSWATSHLFPAQHRNAAGSTLGTIRALPISSDGSLWPSAGDPSTSRILQSLFAGTALVSVIHSWCDRQNILNPLCSTTWQKGIQLLISWSWITRWAQCYFEALDPKSGESRWCQVRMQPIIASRRIGVSVQAGDSRVTDIPLESRKYHSPTDNLILLNSSDFWYTELWDNTFCIFWYLIERVRNSDLLFSPKCQWP